MEPKPRAPLAEAREELRRSGFFRPRGDGAGTGGGGKGGDSGVRQKPRQNEPSNT